MAKNKEKKEVVTNKSPRPLAPFEDLEHYFDEFMRNPFSVLARPQWQNPLFPKGEVIPTADIFEKDDMVVIKAEIPGISKDELEVNVSKDTVTISGEKKREEKVDKKNYHREERCYGSFCRTFRLPENVNSDEAEASFKDGVLEVRIPKSKKSKHKKITVK